MSLFAIQNFRKWLIGAFCEPFTRFSIVKMAYRFLERTFTVKKKESGKIFQSLHFIRTFVKQTGSKR